MTLKPDSTELFMLRAIERARRGMNAGDGGPFGCVIAAAFAVAGFPVYVLLTLRA